MTVEQTQWRASGNQRSGRRHVLRGALLVTVILVGVNACVLRPNSRGVPAAVDLAVSDVSDDIAHERYEKIYNEAAPEWRQAATLDQSIAIFKKVQTKLGSVQNRTLHSASEQDTASGRPPGHVFVLTYRTHFERSEGMETFTLVEHDGHWLLVRYFVNSTALQ
jgi:Protein of unknown function (DUF4019)